MDLHRDWPLGQIKEIYKILIAKMQDPCKIVIFVHFFNQTLLINIWKKKSNKQTNEMNI